MLEHNKGPIYDLAMKYFETYKEDIDTVWFEPKRDTYCCRTKSAEYWQIPLADLKNEIKLLKLGND